jgi:hypothetical protein
MGVSYRVCISRPRHTHIERLMQRNQRTTHTCFARSINLQYIEPPLDRYSHRVGVACHLPSASIYFVGCFTKCWTNIRTYSLTLFTILRKCWTNIFSTCIFNIFSENVGQTIFFRNVGASSLESAARSLAIA